jgi:hypothetical protein
MYLSNLTADQLTRAHEAVHFLLSLPVGLDTGLVIKLDTLHADLTAAIEDIEPAGHTGRHSQ